MRRRRRLPRILLKAATAAFLVLCVAAVLLWVRSYSATDELGHRNAMAIGAPSIKSPQVEATRPSPSSRSLAQRPLRIATMSAKKWPPPGFPLVQGDHALTATWSIHLPEPFARRLEDGSLVLWRPGLTLWLVAWNNDNNQTQAQRLAWIKDAASPARTDVRESARAGVTRFSYRLLDESDDGPVESLNAYVIGDDGHLQVSVYFDNPADAEKAQELVDSVAVRRPT